MRDSLGNIVPRETWDLSDYSWEYGELEAENARLRERCWRLRRAFIRQASDNHRVIRHIYEALSESPISHAPLDMDAKARRYDLHPGDLTFEPHGAASEPTPDEGTHVAE